MKEGKSDCTDRLFLSNNTLTINYSILEMNSLLSVIFIK